MKQIRKNKKYASLIIAFIFICLIVACADSLKNRLTNRLKNFKEALPDEIRTKFENGQYAEAGDLLDIKIKAIRSYTDKLDTDEKKKKYIRGDYKGIEEDLKEMGVPQDLLDFNKRYYKIIDYECIPMFSGQETVEFFRIHFKEKLDSMK